MGFQDINETKRVISNLNPSDKRELEIVNLYKSFQYLQNISNENFLEIDEICLKSHKILMNGLLPPNRCGQFSTDVRYAHNPNGERHYYPFFETDDDA